MKVYNVEIIQGNNYDVEIYYLKSNNKIINKRLSIQDFNSLIEVEHYLKNVFLNSGEKFKIVVIYSSKTEWNPEISFELIEELRQLNRIA